MRIALITPAASRSRSGNRQTAYRWASFLRAMGHRVEVEQRWSGGDAALMIAHHARRSHPSIQGYARRHPARPLVVTLTGTDLYRDIETDADAQESLALATRLVVLQELGAQALPRKYRAKTQTIYQSAPRAARTPPLRSCFEIAVSGHLREEKDPFRTAAAAALLPPASRIRISHMGGATGAPMAAEAQAWMTKEPRYRWLGEFPHGKSLRILARSRLLVVSSRMEGGANVVSEALTLRVPVIASRVPGNVGMLGQDYPGYYRLGDERALARLLARAEGDALFYESLVRACARRAKLVTPARERAGLVRLIAEAARGADPRR